MNIRRTWSLITCFLNYLGPFTLISSTTSKEALCWRFKPQACRSQLIIRRIGLGRKLWTLSFKLFIFQLFFIFFPQAILLFWHLSTKRWIKTRINSSRQFYFFIIFHRSHFDQELLLISCDKEVAESFRRSIWLDQYRLSDHFIEEKIFIDNLLKSARKSRSFLYQKKEPVW